MTTPTIKSGNFKSEVRFQYIEGLPIGFLKLDGVTIYKSGRAYFAELNEAIRHTYLEAVGMRATYSRSCPGRDHEDRVIKMVENYCKDIDKVMEILHPPTKS